jgi:PleD family two-component response regulator
MKIPNEKPETNNVVTIDLGGVTIPAGQKVSVDSIISNTDKALYRDKSNGKNKVTRVN